MSPYVELSPSTGGGGAPGGANTQVQFNNAGAFGGSANLTWDGTTLLVSNGPMEAASFKCTGTSAIFSPATSGSIALRPNGPASNTGQLQITTTSLITNNPVVLPADPTTALQAVTKQYVDNRAVRYDAVQGLTANQQAQARANIDVTQKNYVVNGAMMVSQENGTTAGTTDVYYPVDQFCIRKLNTTGTVAIEQLAGLTPGGSTHRLRVVVTTADASVGATDIVRIQTAIEGFRVSDLKAGSAAAKTITLQFGVLTRPGTYCVAFWNGAGDRSYVAEYVVSAGENNIETVKSVTLPMDVAGAWYTDINTGLYIVWSLMDGQAKTTAGSWVNGNYSSTTNQFNLLGANGNVFQLFDVSLTEGSVAPPFVVPDYAQELTACKRYWERQKTTVYGHAGAASTTAMMVAPYIEKRSTPTVTLISWDSINNASNGAIYDITISSAMVGFNSVSVGVVSARGVTITASARL